MKRVLLTVALCVAASVSFAQKKAVNEAQSIAKGQLLISRKPELLLKELWKIQKQRMTLKLGM